MTARSQETSRALSLLLVVLLTASCTEPGPTSPEEPETTRVIRVAIFNIQELSRSKLDEVDEEGRHANRQLRNAAEIIQRVRPDVLLLNEIDFDVEDRANAGLFIDRFLRDGQGDQEGIEYPHIFFEPTNTGLPSGLDLDNNGQPGDPADAYGFGRYPGQYGMALLSRFPIKRSAARTFQTLLWHAMPDHLIPDGRAGKPAWYSKEVSEVLRLSSKSHWDVPLEIDGRLLHILASHPTPPVFDGPEDRNGRRNFDEIRFWSDYLGGVDASRYIVDDDGKRGGLPATASFVLLGDLNADPFNESPYGQSAIHQLLNHARIFDPEPDGAGGADLRRAYPGKATTRTSSYGRLDYALPSRDLRVRESKVFWPAADSPLAPLMFGAARASDHALVYVDVETSLDP